MIQTLIVDDEPWIVQLIMRLVQWDDLGFQIVGQAANAADAMEMIAHNPPDLIITDIRMPGINGIDLVEAVRKEHPDTFFVIISGYSHFEYARSAIQNGVFAYLLKPIDRSELTDILMRIREEYAKRSRKMMKESFLQAQLTDSLQQLKSTYFSALLHRSTAPAPLSDINTRYHMRMKPGIFQVILYAILSVTTAVPNDESYIKNILNGVIDFITPCFGGCCHEAVFLPEQNYVAVILNSTISSCTAVNAAIQQSDAVLVSRLHLLGEYRYLVSVGHVVPSLTLIADSYAWAKRSLAGRLYSDANVIQLTATHVPPAYAQEIVSLEIIKQIHRFTESHDTAAFSELLDVIYAQDMSDNPYEVYLIAEKILTAVFDVAEGWHTQPGSAPTRAHAIAAVQVCNSIPELKAWLVSLFQTLQTDLVKSQEHQYRDTVERMKHFIHKNYHKDLTLEEICNTVFLSPKYVSGIFKRETGMTIIDYLTDCRIEAAKIYLRNAQYRISTVNELVGYNDAKYFSKVFKKKTGITPVEYRKLFS